MQWFPDLIDFHILSAGSRKEKAAAMTRFANHSFENLSNPSCDICLWILPPLFTREFERRSKELRFDCRLAPINCLNISGTSCLA